MTKNTVFTLTSFVQQMKNSPASISEESIAQMQRFLSPKLRWNTFGLWHVVHIVGVPLVLLVAGWGFGALNILPIWLDNFLPIVAMLIGFFFIFASVDAPGSDSVQKSLALLSQGNQQGCQEALDICAANAQAEQLRSTLVANGRPLRQMHLDYMRKVHHDSERRLVCAQLYRLA